MIVPGIGGLLLGQAVEGHRFVKVQFTSTNGVIEAFEIKLFDEIGGADILGGLTVTASAEQVGHEAPYAHDGDITTWWSASSTPPAGGHWLKFAAAVGQVINPKLLHLLPRVFIVDQCPTDIAVSVSDDDVTYTPLFAMTTEATNTRYIDFEPKAADPTGYRYLWFEVTGNNFSGANPSYIKWLEIFGAEGQDLALQATDFIGSRSLSEHAAVLGLYQTGGTAIAIGDTLAIDLGKRRTTPLSARVTFIDDTLLAAHGVKNWRLRGNSINDLATATTIATITDAGAAPASGAARTYTF